MVSLEEAAFEEELPVLLVGVTVLEAALVAREGVGLELEDWLDVVMGVVQVFLQRLRFRFQL